MQSRGTHFYVYMYVIKDKEIPLYVGKGKDGRCLEHMLNARKGINSSPLIQEIISLGYERGVDIRVVKDNLDEEEALKIESELIAHIGRRDIQTGPLLNRSAGGEGISGGIDRYGYRGVGIARKITDLVDHGCLIQDIPDAVRAYVANVGINVKFTEERIIPHIQEMGNAGRHYKGPKIQLYGWQFSLNRKMIDVNGLTLETKGVLKVHGDLPKNHGTVSPAPPGYDFGY